MTRTRTRSRILSVTGAALAVALLDAGLTALPAAATQPVTAFGGVWVASWGPATATVCAYGEVDDGTYVKGAWTFTVTGIRADGLPPAGVSAPYDGPTFSDCLTVTVGTVLVGVKGTLTLAAAGTGDVTTVAGVVGARTLATAPFAIQYTTSG